MARSIRSIQWPSTPSKITMFPRSSVMVPSCSSSSSDDDDEHFSPQQVATCSLRDHLNEQLALLNLPLRDRQLASALVDALDDDARPPAEQKSEEGKGGAGSTGAGPGEPNQRLDRKYDGELQQRLHGDFGWMKHRRSGDIDPLLTYSPR